MKAPVEWAFRFSMASLDGRNIDYSAAENLLWLATEWAEDNDYGIGGGFQSCDQGPGFWRFSFGLAATQSSQSIPESKANQLWQLLEASCHGNCYELKGGFREFTDEELSL